jgi:hypothetical protein
VETPDVGRSVEAPDMRRAGGARRVALLVEWTVRTSQAGEGHLRQARTLLHGALETPQNDPSHHQSWWWWWGGGLFGPCTAQARLPPGQNKA